MASRTMLGALANERGGTRAHSCRRYGMRDAVGAPVSDTWRRPAIRWTWSAGGRRWCRRRRRGRSSTRSIAWINEIITSEDGKKFLNSIGGDPWVSHSGGGASLPAPNRSSQWGDWSARRQY